MALRQSARPRLGVWGWFIPKRSKIVDHASFPIDERIGRRLRARRLAAGMGLGTFARAIGVSYQQMHLYESGQTRISAAMVVRSSEILACTTDHLLGEDFDPLQRELEKRPLNYHEMQQVLRAFAGMRQSQRQAVVKLILAMAAPAESESAELRTAVTSA